MNNRNRKNNKPTWRSTTCASDMDCIAAVTDRRISVVVGDNGRWCYEASANGVRFQSESVSDVKSFIDAGGSL